jgi:lipoprotein-anchoring transpeptidase ErfK/SrfK
MRHYYFVLLVAIPVIFSTPVGAAPKDEKATSKEVSIVYDSNVVGDPAVTPPIAPGHSGPAVLRAQILLDRANFSPGEIDGSYGRNFRNSLLAFQKLRGIPESEVMDPATWAALNEDTQPVLHTYVIAKEDVAGPFRPAPAPMAAKAKLDALNFASPLEGIAEKLHSSPKLIAALNPGQSFDKVGGELLAPNVFPHAPLRPAARIVVDASDLSVSAIAGDGTTIAHFPASAGSERDPLPLGEWKITGVRRNPVFHYNPKLFWDADPNDQRQKIAAGPNNPVGIVWIDLSKDHYGIHGTPEPSKIGYTQSHGCIRLTNWDAWKLAAMVKPGTPAILQE